MRTDLLVARLNDIELLSRLKRISLNERKVQSQFLAYLAEVEKRELYAIEGYPSLHDYVVNALGHSSSTALKRIQVARQARRFPILYELLEEGKLSMTALSKLSPYLKGSTHESLLQEAQGKTVREIERLIVKYFPKAEVGDYVKHPIAPLSIDKVAVSFCADSEFEEKLNKAKALLSHKYPEGKLKDILGEALSLLIEHLEKKKGGKSRVSDTPESHTRHIPRGISAELWNKAQNRCEYISPSGRRCDSEAFLEIDHIKPYALGGSSTDPENLRVLCRTHNRLMANHWFGREWMEERIAKVLYCDHSTVSWAMEAKS